MKQNMRLFLIIAVAILAIIISVFARITGDAIYARQKDNIAYQESKNPVIDSSLNNKVILNNSIINQTIQENQSNK